MEVTSELRELADHLREIAEQLTTREIGAERVSRAVRLSRELRDELEGPRFTPWYEIDAEDPRAVHTRAQFDATSPFGGAINPLAPPMRIEMPDDPKGRVIGRVRLSRAYEGPPRGVHGGVVAGMFDEILGEVQALAPPVGMTGRLDVVYRRVTPIETDLVFEGWVDQDRGRAILAKATCSAGGQITAEANALFVRVDFRQVAEREG